MAFRKPSRLWITTAVATSIVASGFTSIAQASPARPIGLNDAAPSLTEDVRYKRRHVRARRGGNAAGAAIALGVLGLAAGAAIAGSRQRDYYDDGYYYAPGPTYYYGSPGYYGRQHYRGYNRSDYYGQRQVYRDHGGYRGQRGYYGGPGLAPRVNPYEDRRPDSGGR